MLDSPAFCRRWKMSQNQWRPQAADGSATWACFCGWLFNIFLKYAMQCSSIATWNITTSISTYFILNCNIHFGFTSSCFSTVSIAMFVYFWSENINPPDWMHKSIYLRFFSTSVDLGWNVVRASCFRLSRVHRLKLLFQHCCVAGVSPHLLTRQQNSCQYILPLSVQSCFSGTAGCSGWATGMQSGLAQQFSAAIYQDVQLTLQLHNEMLPLLSGRFCSSIPTGNRKTISEKLILSHALCRKCLIYTEVIPSSFSLAYCAGCEMLNITIFNFSKVLPDGVIQICILLHKH